MVDPGSAVGAVSLALQVLQGLHSYYSQFASYHEDIQAISIRLERLSVALRLLEAPLQKLESDGDHISEEVWSCIAECLKGVKKLERHLEKCGEAENSQNFLKKKMVLVKQRIAYPFRKPSLQDLRTNLDGLSSNLQLVLQTLHLDTAIDFAIRSDATALAMQESQNMIQTQQSYQTELTETLDTRMINVQSSTDASIRLNQQSFAVIQQRQNHQLELSQAIEDQLSRATTQEATRASASHEQLLLLNREQTTQSTLLQGLMDSMRNQESRIEQLINDPRRMPPQSMLREACDGHISLTKKGDEYMSKSSMAKTSRHTPFEGSFKCYCPRFSRPNDSPSRFTFVTVNWKRRRNHLPSCPLYPFAKVETTLQLRFKACRRALGYIVEANLKWVGMSMSNSIDCWNLVPDDAPTFRLLYVATLAIRPGSLVRRIMETLIKGLLQLLRDGRAGINDVDETGQTLMHNTCEMLGFVFRKCASQPIYMEDITHIVGTLIQLGVRSDPVDLYGNLPTTKLFKALEMSHDPDSSLIVNIISSYNLEWKWDVAGVTGLYNSRKLREVHKQLSRVGNSHHGLLLLAILQNSEPDLRKILESRNEINADDEDEQLALHAAADWPKGVELLLAHGVSPTQKDPDGWHAADYAVMYGNLEALTFLLQAGAELSRGIWSHIIRVQGDSAVVELVAKWLYRTYATREASSHLKLSDTLETHTLYHENGLQLRDAKILHDAGFSNVNAAPLKQNGKPSPATPALVHALRIDATELLRPGLVRLELLQWLIDAGADLEYQEPEFGISAAHVLAERLGLLLVESWQRCHHDRHYFIHGSGEIETSSTRRDVDGRGRDNGWTEVEPDRLNATETERGLSSTAFTKEALCIASDLLTALFNKGYVDSCSCGCSSEGCSTGSTILKMTRHICDDYSVNLPWENLSNMEAKVQVLRILSSNHEMCLKLPPLQVPSILRILTFDELQLTHTCHKIHHSRHTCHLEKSLAWQDIKDIHDLEAHDLALLEELLAEFEDVWKDFRGTIFQYIRGYWAQRMKEVLASRIVSETEAQRQLIEAGITIAAPENMIGPQTSPDIDELLPTPGSVEWFEREVEMILDGSYPRNTGNIRPFALGLIM